MRNALVLFLVLVCITVGKTEAQDTLTNKNAKSVRFGLTFYFTIPLYPNKAQSWWDEDQPPAWATLFPKTQLETGIPFALGISLAGNKWSLNGSFKIFLAPQKHFSTNSGSSFIFRRDLFSINSKMHFFLNVDLDLHNIGASMTDTTPQPLITNQGTYYTPSNITYQSHYYELGLGIGAGMRWDISKHLQFFYTLAGGPAFYRMQILIRDNNNAGKINAPTNDSAFLNIRFQTGLLFLFGK